MSNLYIEEERHHKLEDALWEGRQLAHHARCLVPRLAQRDQKLGCQLAGCLLQSLRTCNLKPLLPPCLLLSL